MLVHKPRGYTIQRNTKHLKIAAQFQDVFRDGEGSWMFVWLDLSVQPVYWETASIKILKRPDFIKLMLIVSACHKGEKSHLCLLLRGTDDHPVLLLDLECLFCETAQHFVPNIEFSLLQPLSLLILLQASGCGETHPSPNKYAATSCCFYHLASPWRLSVWLLYFLTVSKYYGMTFEYMTIYIYHVYRAGWSRIHYVN